MEKLLISACLLGVSCRYDGKSKPMKDIEKLMEKGFAADTVKKFTDLMSIIYYGVTVLLVEFGKVFLAGLALHLLTDIAYNTFKNRKK